MNKILRSLLLKWPRIYQFIFHFKNNYQINFYLNKVHERDFEAFRLLPLDESKLFVDIGANVGMSALSILTINSHANIVSFEPNPVNYAYLDRLADKFVNFQYLSVGLGAKTSNIPFYYPIYNNKRMTALGSYDRNRAENWLNEDTVYFFSTDRLKIEKITIEVETLDRFQLKPDYVKIDVEGFEQQVLLGATQTIEHDRPILLIEGVSWNDSVHQLLDQWQYQAYRFENDTFYLDEFDCDNNFFIPQEKIEAIEAYLS